MSKVNKNTSYGLLALRVSVAIIFIFMGWAKLGDISAFAGMLEAKGFFAPQFFAYLVAGVEFLGGLGVLFGVYLRFFSKLLAIVMIVALLVVHAGGEFKAAMAPIALLGSTLALMFMGGGDWMLTKKDFTLLKD